MTPLKSMDPAGRGIPPQAERISVPPVPAPGLRSAKSKIALDAGKRPVTQSLDSMGDCGCLAMVARFLIWASRNAR